MQDIYTWQAVYTDGTSLSQIDSDGKKHAYGDINRDLLSEFKLLNGAGVVALSVPFTPGQQLIWRRRSEMRGGVTNQIVHIVGKKETINGQERQIVFALFPDGHAEVSDKFDEANPWFFPVKINVNEGEVE